MILRYVLPNGEPKEQELSDKPITIGRSSEADICIPDSLASRTHCSISFWNDGYFIRDLKSRNGTFVNDKPVDIAPLKAGDRVRVGNIDFHVEAFTRKGTETVLMEVQDEMSKGKGYHTILQEIIEEEKRT